MCDIREPTSFLLMGEGFEETIDTHWFFDKFSYWTLVLKSFPKTLLKMKGMTCSSKPTVGEMKEKQNLYLTTDLDVVSVHVCT